MKTLTDKFGRQINYLRISLTDRCNLRCRYCMPSRGIKFFAREELLSYEQILTLIDMLGEYGFTKVRITGGEPFVRTNIGVFLKRIQERKFLESIAITTNLTLTSRYLGLLDELGIRNINVSLDCYDRKKFIQITRRDQFEAIQSALFWLIKKQFNLKINCVVLRGINEDQIFPLLKLSEEHPIAVRFLEEMPFNGSHKTKSNIFDCRAILNEIRKKYDFHPIESEPSSTSQNYRIKGFAGTFGVIPSFTRTFCNQCNRLRISASGDVRTCLYGKSQLNLKSMLEEKVDPEQIMEALKKVILAKPIDGFAAEKEGEKVFSSMSKLGG